MQAILVALIRIYQYLISPWVGHHCRFHPTCSNYALTAIERFGTLKGSLLAAKRLAKCHPWHPGGIDLVPDNLGNSNG